MRRIAPEVRDWDAAIGLAAAHGAAGILAGSLIRSGALEELPEPARRSLGRLRRAAIFVFENQVAMLGEVRSRFERAGVPFVLLKGLGLAERLYEDSSDRMGIDVDVLVREEDLRKAGEQLEAMGFRPAHPDHYRARHFHIPYYPVGNRYHFAVEVHWEVTPATSPVQFRARDWLGSARPVELRCGPVLLPGKADEIAHVAWHAFAAGSPRLRDLRDAALLWEAHRDAEERASTAARAADAGAGLFLRETLELGAALWGEGAGQGPDPGPAAIPSRRWIARKLLEPSPVVRREADRWWPYGKILYWSLLRGPEAGILFLFRESIRGEKDAARIRGGRFGWRETARALAEMLAALAVSLGPGRARRGTRSSAR